MTTARECLGPLASYIPHSSFTHVQECVIPTLVQSETNVVVAAPTGSGKTALLEAAMLRLFSNRLLPTSPVAAPEAALSAMGGCHGGATEGKVVYICPIKALASEKYTLWREKFPTLSVALETGDQELVRAYEGGILEVPNADIIITTPERWDSITRRWKEGVVWSLVASVVLLLLDEVHTVSEERGAALEAVVSRMKAIKASMSSRAPRCCTTRFVAISGTLPNINDFAEWLQVPPGGVFSFTSADRPVPLTLRVVSYPSTANNPFAFDRFLSFKLFGLIRQFSEGRPTIVFCASRSEAKNSALRVVEAVREAASREGAEKRLQPTEEVDRMAATANDKQLRSLLLLGIAYHHAAMSTSDRALVERMFKEHYISVVCTTTTLALGVNLPAHLVIIKGTTFFKGGRREDLPLSEVAQMSGRAGRPGLDTHGVALVLTTDAKAALYDSLRHGDSCTTVESCLHQKMIEHVNAEIALRTIHTFSLGVEWIKTTFLWIRLQRCPRHYGILFTTKEEELRFDPEQFAAQLMCRMLTELERQGCITIRRYSASAEGGKEGTKEEKEQLNGGRAHITCDSGMWDCMSRGDCIVESTRVGRAMARRYILFKTVEMFNTETRCALRLRHSDVMGTPRDEIAGSSHDDKTDMKAPMGVPNTFTFPRLLEIISRSTEFDDLRLRQGDRRHLNEMNKIIRFPLKSGMRGGREVREDWHKVYVLIQAHLEHVTIGDFSLRNDCVRMWTIVPRLARFLADYARTLDSFSLFRESSLLERCMEQRMWWDGPVLRQLDGVGEAVAKALFGGGVRDFDDVLKADPRMLEALCGRNPPFGSELHQRCGALWRCQLSLEPSGALDTLRAVITVKPRQRGEARGSRVRHYMTVIVGETSADRILLSRQFIPEESPEGPLVFTFQVPRGFCGRIVGQVFTDQHLLGTNTSAVITLGVNDGEKAENEGGGGVQSDVVSKTLDQANEGENNVVSLAAPSSAFDALTRDLRFLAGISPLRATNAPYPSLPSSRRDKGGLEADGERGCVGGDQGVAGGPMQARSPSNCEAGTFVGESSPEAAALVQPRDDDDATKRIDNDYRKLVKRTADIASTLRFDRGASPPSHAWKRSRENIGKSSSACMQPRGYPCFGHGECYTAVSQTGGRALLSRAAPPEMLTVPLSDDDDDDDDDNNEYRRYERPSARFRFTVQGEAAAAAAASPSPVAMHAFPLQRVRKRKHFAAGGMATPALHRSRGVFSGASSQHGQMFVLPRAYAPPSTARTYAYPSLAHPQAPGGTISSEVSSAAYCREKADTRQARQHSSIMFTHMPSFHGWSTEWSMPVVSGEGSPQPTPGSHWVMNNVHSHSGLEPFHGNHLPTSIPVGRRYGVSNRRRVATAPRATAVRRGWW